MAVVEARGVGFSYGGLEVLRGVSLRAGPGEVVAILGATGSGKTTLLRLLAGLLEPSRGEVLLDGRPLRSQLPGARRRIGLVFQNPLDQFFNPTVYDEIAYALRSLGLPEREVEKRVRLVASRLGLGGLLDRHPLRLSTGQQRLVALASVLVYEPEVLLLDEPSSNLDRASYEKLVCLVEEHRRRGGTVVIASHDLSLVIEAADRLYMIEDGVVKAAAGVAEALRTGLLEYSSLPLPVTLRVLVEEKGWEGLAGAVERLRRRRCPGPGF